MIFVVFAILIFLVLRFTVTLFNFLSNPKLGRSRGRFEELVSILVPVGNQENDIVNFLESIQEQDYADYEVIIMNYNSTDDTIHLAEEFCRSDNRFRVVEGEERISKNAVRQLLSEYAQGNYLLYLEPTAVVKPRFIDSLIHRMKLFNLSALSIIPNQYMPTFIEKCILPLSDYIMLNLVPLRLVSLSKSQIFSAGSNQCMFFDGKIYREENWYGRLSARDTAGGDVIRLIKQEKQKAEVLLANKFIWQRRSRTGERLVDFFGYVLLPSFGYNVLAVITYLLLIIVGPLFLMTYVDFSLYVLPIGLIFLTRVMISFLTNQSVVWNVLLHPLQMFFLMVILLKAVFVRKKG